jgi:hypothetical protein
MLLWMCWKSASGWRARRATVHLIGFLGPTFASRGGGIFHVVEAGELLPIWETISWALVRREQHHILKRFSEVL